MNAERADQPEFLQTAELLLLHVPVTLEQLSPGDGERADGRHARSL